MNRFFPTLMGAFGVAMGFAAFVLVREQTQSRAASPVTFLLGLLAASVTSFAIESVRERAEGHNTGAVVEPGRVLGLIVLLAVFEVYVSGAEEVVKLLAGGEAEMFVSALFVSGITDGLGIVPQLMMFAGLWVALGAAAAWSMMPDDPVPVVGATSYTASVSQTGWRIARGLLLVACLALVYVIVARLALTLWVLLTRPQDYAPAFASLLTESTTQTGNPFARVSILLASTLEGLAHLGRWGGVLLLAVTAGLAVVVRRSTRAGMSASVPVRIVMLTLVLLVLGPFVTSTTQFARLVRIVTATTLTWIAPLVVLAVATPWLRAPSRSPRIWGIVAFAVAVVLVLVTWDRLSQPPVPLFVASFVVALTVTGWLFWRGADVVKFWPLVALTLAIAAFEGSSVLQRLSFLTTFKEAALLQAAPLTGGVEAQVTRGFRTVVGWQSDGSVDANTATLVATAQNLADTTTDQEVEQRERQLSLALGRVFTASVDTLCRDSGSALLDTLHRDIRAWCTRAYSLGSLSRDSVQRFLTSLFNAPEPWGNGLGSLVTGAEPDAVRDAYAFRWQSRNTAIAARIREHAQQALPVADASRDPADLMSQAMRDGVLTPSTRLWMVLAAFAGTSLPDERLNYWLNDADQRDLAESRRADGMLLHTALSLWHRRVRHLHELVEARYLPGVPAAALPTGLRLAPRPVNRFQRETRTIIALRFATEQLRAQREERRSSTALQADVGATVLLELSLGASFAFWSTAGLLAGLSRREANDAPSVVDATS